MVVGKRYKEELAGKGDKEMPTLAQNPPIPRSGIKDFMAGVFSIIMYAVRKLVPNRGKMHDACKQSAFSHEPPKCKSQSHGPPTLAQQKIGNPKVEVKGESGDAFN